QLSYGYDNAGNLTSTTINQLTGGLVGSQSVTDDTVDAADQVTARVVDPPGLDRVTSYTYNADNQVTGATLTSQAGTSSTAYTYDTAGDMTGQDVQDGSLALDTTWT